VNRLIHENKDRWKRLEELLARMNSRRGDRPSRIEVREFGELYRRAAADLAIARSETRDPRLIEYLNGLVIRAHGQIYRAESGGASVLARFFLHELPLTFRANLGYMAVAFAVFAAFAAFGFIATWVDTDFTHFVMLSGITQEIRAGNEWWLSLNEANQIGATHILSNNILVTMRVFAMGAFLGVGAFYDLAFEGARFGSVFAACYKLNPPFGNSLATFVVGHGVVELSCIFFCGGAGMMIGHAIIAPGDLTRGASIKNKGLEAVRIVVGCACFLVVAGIIEGFLSPADIPAAFKFATGIGTGIAMYSYLLLVGRREALSSTQ
jgi:uncharacterized membrane protein SpoIIM required for sporulation